VGCAILSRSLDRTGTTVPDVCTQCFSRFCWNGTVDSSTPKNDYEPTPVLGEQKLSSRAPTRLVNRWAAAAAAVMAIATAL
jgi:lysophospholipase